MEKPVPWTVTADCPTDDCAGTFRVRWPADDPESVVCWCHRCHENAVIERDGSIRVGVSD